MSAHRLPARAPAGLPQDPSSVPAAAFPGTVAGRSDLAAGGGRTHDAVRQTDPPPMTALVTHHPWLSLLAALLLGMTVEWVLEFLFVRRRMFDLERQLNERERDYTELRHSHGRTLNDLKNKLTELDAVQKARVLAETSAAARDREMATLRTEAEGHARRLAGAESARQDAETALQEARASLAEAVRSRESAEAEAGMARSRVRDLELQLADLTARLATESEAVVQLRAGCETRGGEADTAAAEVARLSAELEARNSAVSSLEQALRSRDTTVASLQTRINEAEGERASVAAALASADDEVARLRESLVTLQARLATSGPLEAEKASLTAQVSRLQANISTATRARGEAEERIRTLEAQLEHLSQQPSAPGPDAGRIAELEAEIAAVSVSHARLEAELEALRSRSEAQPAAAGGPGGNLDALLADLDAVTRERNELAAELASIRADDAGRKPHTD